jgi:hypothetical protein
MSWTRRGGEAEVDLRLVVCGGGPGLKAFEIGGWIQGPEGQCHLLYNGYSHFGVCATGSLVQSGVALGFFAHRLR